MLNSYIKLGAAAAAPAVLSAVLVLLEKKTPFGKIDNKKRQVIYGILFGLLAVLGTEAGIPVNGAQMNCRDAAVISAGLFFGAPAGIIAGVIGGVERWFAVLWGIGSFTRVACTVSTLLAGVYAALLRKFMFENKRPGWFISLAIGIVVEVFHMTMVFITNMAQPETAIDVVKRCTHIMVPLNGIAVMLSAVVIVLISREKFIIRGSRAKITQTIQRRLLVTVVLAFIATSLFVFSFQTKIADAQADTLLSLAIQGISDDISDASDENMLMLAHRVAEELADAEPEEEAAKYDLDEVNLIDENGVIFKSTKKQYIGFEMASGKQSAEFLCLLDDRTEYVQQYGATTYNREVSRKYAGVKTDYGFLQIGYGAEAFQRDIDSRVVGITKNRSVGETGFVMIVDEDLNIVSAPAGLVVRNLNESEAALIPGEDITFSLDIDGKLCRCSYRTTEGYYILAAVPEEEALRMRNIALYVNTFMEILVFAVLFGLIYLLIKKVVVNQITTINRSLAKITDGDLDEVVNVRTNEEFASLSDDINSTVDTLKRYIAEASERVAAELKAAKEIQASALPSEFPAFPQRGDFDIFADMKPAKEVGGDFYDFYITDENTLHFLIADVSGKGIPAAMFMMRAMTELKNLTQAGKNVADVFTDANDFLCEGNDAGMFVTAWQGGIDLADGTVRFANAGHNPPLVRRGSGEFTYLRTVPGLVLAGMEGMEYKAQEMRLEPGDVIFLYTDGVTEAMDPDGELFGEERLCRSLNSRPFSGAEELCRAVKADVEAFVNGAPQFDDITMLALIYTGK